MAPFPWWTPYLEPPFSVKFVIELWKVARICQKTICLYIYIDSCLNIYIYIFIVDYIYIHSFRIWFYQAHSSIECSSLFLSLVFHQLPCVLSLRIHRQVIAFERAQATLLKMKQNNVKVYIKIKYKYIYMYIYIKYINIYIKYLNIFVCQRLLLL